MLGATFLGQLAEMPNQLQQIKNKNGNGRNYTTWWKNKQFKLKSYETNLNFNF